MSDTAAVAVRPSFAVELARSRWAALGVLCTGMLMIVLDATVVNVALPAIQADLGFSQAGLAWVVNAYLIAFGGLLLLAGRLGDLISRRGVFLAGLSVVTIASLGRGVAPAEALTQGYHTGFWAAGVLIVLALVVAVGVLRPDRVSAR